MLAAASERLRSLAWKNTVWAARDLPDGRQVWVQMRDGEFLTTDGAQIRWVIPSGVVTDPELRYSSDGEATAILLFSVAVDGGHDSGETGERAEQVFHDVAAFGSVAEDAAKSLEKGTGRPVSTRKLMKRDRPAWGDGGCGESSSIALRPPGASGSS